MKNHSTADNLCWTCLGAVRKGVRTPHTLHVVYIGHTNTWRRYWNTVRDNPDPFPTAVMCLKCTFTRTLPSAEEEPKPLPQVAPGLLTTHSAGSSPSLCVSAHKPTTVLGERMPRSPASFWNWTVLNTGSGQTPEASSHWVSNTFRDGNSVTSLTMVEAPASVTASNPGMLLGGPTLPCPPASALHAGKLQLYPSLSLSYLQTSEVIKPHSYSGTKTLRHWYIHFGT